MIPRASGPAGGSEPLRFLGVKALEDRGDALLCALAVALEHLEPGTMLAYTGEKPRAWRPGYILAPVLRGARPE